MYCLYFFILSLSFRCLTCTLAPSPWCLFFIPSCLPNWLVWACWREMGRGWSREHIHKYSYFYYVSFNTAFQCTFGNFLCMYSVLVRQMSDFVMNTSTRVRVCSYEHVSIGFPSWWLRVSGLEHTARMNGFILLHFCWLYRVPVTQKLII